MFFWVALSVPDTAAVNPKRTKTLFTNGLNTLPIKDKPVFINYPRSLPKNSSNSTILTFFKISCCLLNHLQKLYKSLKLVYWLMTVCGKLVSPSPIIFGERFNVSWVPFCIPDFNLLSCELDELYIYIELFNIISKQNKLIILLQLLWKIQNSFFCFFNNEKHCCISCSI